MKININRSISTSLYQQISSEIKNRILSGELANGYKLPSERTLAKQLSVHRNTIIKAYDVLISENLIESSVSPRGYFVTYETSIHSKAKSNNFKYRGALNFLIKDDYYQFDSLFSELFYDSSNSKKGAEIIPMAADVITPDLFPKAELNAITEKMVREDFDWFNFMPAQGFPPFIDSIIELLSQRNIRVSHKEVQIVSETYEALQYICKVFLSPNDTIIAEEPISPDIFQVFQLIGINVITVPMDNNGMKTEYLEGLINKYHPKLIYTIPTYHYPTSTVMSLSRRYELLSVSYKYDIPIIEEDCDSSIKYTSDFIPSIKSLDTMGNVIYINSFIGTICPGIRLAYMVAPERIIKAITFIMENTQIFINPISQYIACEFINSGGFYSQIYKICDFARINRDLLCSGLKEVADIDYEFSIPTGGTSLWCRLKEPVNAKKLLMNAHSTGISYIPGHLFFPFRNQGENYLRLCYGNIAHEEVKTAIDRLSKAVRMTREPQ
jgi:2-aminoadipate transaminase